MANILVLDRTELARAAGKAVALRAAGKGTDALTWARTWFELLGFAEALATDEEILARADKQAAE